MAITVTDYQPDDTVAIDSYIDVNAPNTNYGSADQMQIGSGNAAGYGKSLLIRFDWIWQGLGGSNTPGANPKMKFVSDLTLKLYAVSNTGGVPRTDLYYVKRNWVESEVTHNNWKSGNAWQSAGAIGADDSLNMVWTLNDWQAIPGWNTILISGQLLQFGISGQYYGLMLRGCNGSAANQYFVFCSSSYATPANRPKYTFSYEPYHKVLPISAGYGGVK